MECWYGKWIFNEEIWNSSLGLGQAGILGVHASFRRAPFSSLALLGWLNQGACSHSTEVDVTHISTLESWWIIPLSEGDLLALPRTFSTQTTYRQRVICWQGIFCGRWRAKEEAIKRDLDSWKLQISPWQAVQSMVTGQEEETNMRLSFKTLQVEPEWGDALLLLI